MRIPFLNKKPTEFGSCCHDLKEAMTKPPNSLFRISEWGVLYLTVGYVHSDDGIGWIKADVHGLFDRRKKTFLDRFGKKK